MFRPLGSFAATFLMFSGLAAMPVSAQACPDGQQRGVGGLCPPPSDVVCTVGGICWSTKTYSIPTCNLALYGQCIPENFFQALMSNGAVSVQITSSQMKFYNSQGARVLTWQGEFSGLVGSVNVRDRLEFKGNTSLRLVITAVSF